MSTSNEPINQNNNNNNNSKSSSSAQPKRPTSTSPPVKPTPDVVPPQTAASWYQWPLFSWMVPLFEKGQERTDADEPLLASDLYGLPGHEDPLYNAQRLQVNWQLEIAKSRQDPEYKPNMTEALWQTYKYRILIGGAFRFISDGATFAQPFLLKEFTIWVQDPRQATYIGWMWLIGIVGLNILMTTLLNFSQQHTQTAFYQMQSAIRILVFENLLNYPANHEDAGKITSAVTSDMMQLVSLAQFISGLYISIVIVLGSVGALYYFSGYAALVTFGFMLFTMPLQMVIMGKLFGLRVPIQAAGTRRVQTLTELLQGVRIMKQMVWEKNFSKKIFDARAEELVYYNQMLNWRIPLFLLIVALPQLQNFLLFALQYVFEGDVVARTALPALTVLSGIRVPLFFIPLAYSQLFNVIVAMQRVAEVCTAHSDRHVYLTRYPDHKTAIEATSKNNNNNSNGEEKIKSKIETIDEDVAIEMKNITIIGDIDHEKKKKKGPPAAAGAGSPPGPVSTATSPIPASSPVKPNPDAQQQQQKEQEMKMLRAASNSSFDSKLQIIVKDISLKIPKGKLTIIVGPTASGKSLLVNALLGEADVLKDGGCVHVYGSEVALVSQQAWIMNATARDNILMNTPYDEELYNKCVDAAQLTPDFEILPGNDQAELGSKGVSISGGQKARIAIARAIYSGRRTIISDDCLAAVDPGVANAIFDACLSNEGMCRDRTRVLVTHQAHLIPKADKVVVMRNCEKVFDGTVDELRASGLYEVLEAEEEADAQRRKEREEKAAADKKKKDAAAEKKKKEDAIIAAALAAARKESGEAVSTTEEPSPLGAEKAKQKEIEQKQKSGKLTVEEINEAGSVTGATYAWYGSLGGYGQFLLMLLFAVLSSGCFVMANVFLALWSSKQPLGRIPSYDNITYLWIMGTFTAVGSFFLIFRQTFFATFMGNVAQNIHEAMAKNILRAPSAWFDQNPLSRVLNRLSKDLSQIDFAIFESLQMVINMLFAVLAAVITVCISAPYILVITPFLTVFLYHVFSFYANTVRGLKRLEGSSNSPYLGLLGEVTSGLASIRAFGTGEQLKIENEKRVIESTIPAYNSKQAQRRLSAQTDLAGTIILFFAVFFGALSRSVDTSSWLPLNPALVALAISSALTATNSITMLTRTLAEFETSFVSVERAREYTVSIPQEPIYDYDAENNLPAPGPEWPVRAEIEFKNYSMRYRPELPLVLNNVSFKIEGGTRVAAVGRTGSGKSSSLMALQRMVEAASGHILIDGRPIDAVNLPDLRSKFTSLPQEATLFSGTIRSNLDPFDEQTDADIWEVLDKLHLRERLTTFIKGENEGKGLEAKIAGGGGSNFSAGERQLLCLARALLKKSKILLVDEGTAACDGATDALIQKILRTDFKGVTSIIIAHRLATIIDCDRVIVLDQGMVVENDSPINLLNKPHGEGVFRGMCEQLGNQQFEVLKQIASGVRSYDAALEMKTEIQEEA